MLAVIPARGGSTGLPGKNIRSFAGLPLIAHSILLARACPDIERCLVSTDSEEIARVARDFGAEVPFLRPQELARVDTPIWPVLHHALDFAERDNKKYPFLLLLDPTSPTRLPEDISVAFRRLVANPSADGIVSASRPDFNPLWHCVVEKDGWMQDLLPQGSGLERRQEAPPVFRINGLLYIWRTEFVRSQDSWRTGRNLLYETPELRAVSIDDLTQFQRAELLVTSGLIRLPWLKSLS
ncbi:MAG: acylneuraminate cytidylyltransferase family protein [Elusimicrobia bacterium]|nr:acylneuraminate cytidylyltransferase family protein [Elusimicrobiota bacterium]